VPTKTKTTKVKQVEPEYFCLAVRREYETVWRVIGKYETPEQAETALNEKRAYEGSFNYNNAELKVMSRTEAKQQFGATWEYHPIGTKPGTPVAKPKRVSKNDDDY
jgi:hypothetical protein